MLRAASSSPSKYGCTSSCEQLILQHKTTSKLFILYSLCEIFWLLERSEKQPQVVQVKQQLEQPQVLQVKPDTVVQVNFSSLFSVCNLNLLINQKDLL